MRLWKVLPLIIVGAFATNAFAQEEFGKKAGEGRAFAHHNLQVNLAPSTHFLRAVDEIELVPGAHFPITFRLRDTMLITGLWDENGNDIRESLERLEANADDETPSHLVSYKLNLPSGSRKFRISYEGEIYDPVKEAKTLAFVRGDETTGIIGEEGIYLDAGSGWYPLEDDALATFEMKAEVTTPYVLVAQGDLVGRLKKLTYPEIEVSHWRSSIPQDGFTLVGNKFVVKTRQIGEVSTSTYFLEEDAGLADEYLDATAKYLEFYQKLLGKFPYNRFDIVENFFQTGYGMPGYTLLGSAVIKMHYTGEFAIGHELMHNWWGNYVFFDEDKGNWCEALTTYLTNYYWLEASGQDEKAREWRKHASIKYSINVPPEKAYPLRMFREKRNEIDGAIGYEKGAMFFHAIRKLVGDYVFFSGLGDVIEKFGGEFAEWNDFKIAFVDRLKEKKPDSHVVLVQIEEMFNDWLDKPDAPSFFIKEIEKEPGKLEVRISQKEPYFPVNVPFVGYRADGSIATSGEVYLVSEASVYLSGIDRIEPIKKIELDPEWHSFRRVPLTAIEPCLNIVLNEENAYVIYPSGTDAVSAELNKLVPILKSSGRKLKIVSDAEFELEMKEKGGRLDNSIFVLGGEDFNSAWKVIRDIVPKGVFNVSKDSFSLGTKSYSGQAESLLITVTNPVTAGRFISVYHGNSVEALARARMIFYYGWDSWIVFNEGRPVERGKFPAETNPWVATVKDEE